MDKDQRRFNRRVLIILVVAILMAAGLIVYVKLHDRQYSAKLNIQVAPSSAQVTINGKKSHAGMIAVKPGNYDVIALKNGFTTTGKAVKVAKGQTQYIGLALASNSDSTANWYSDHPDDQKLLEIITGQQFKQQSEQSVQQVPLIKSLPYIGVGFEFRVDYGAPLPGTDVPGIYITAATQQGYQDALTWIKNQGVDPSTLHIQWLQQAPDGSGTSSVN